MMKNAFFDFLKPLLWPIHNIVATYRLTGAELTPVMKAEPSLPLPVHFAVTGGALRAFILAWFCIYGLYDAENYPAFGRAAALEFSWMWPIIVRNVVATWLICGFWDWWLYFGPMKEKLHRYKITQRYPSFRQMKHDAFYTTLASIFASLLEIVCCHQFATGSWPSVRSLWEKPLLHLILIPTLTHCRVPHFWAIHRVMHPWRTERFPDIGKLLYKWIHSLHHKSYNITTFSGTNMHPIEATLYYSAGLMCIPFGVHPALPLAVMIDCAMGAWIGHDGYVYPGGGDYYHTLHHIHFDCNYCSPIVPIDEWLGEYAGSKEEVTRMWGRKRAGREANETYVHEDSKSEHVE